MRLGQSFELVIDANSPRKNQVLCCAPGSYTCAGQDLQPRLGSTVVVIWILRISEVTLRCNYLAQALRVSRLPLDGLLATDLCSQETKWSTTSRGRQDERWRHRCSQPSTSQR